MRERPKSHLPVPLSLLACLTLGIAGIGIGGCSEDPFQELADNEYVVFGDFYGECLGEGCVDIYKIQSKKVYEDTLDQYPSANQLPHNVAFIETGSDDFEQLNEILATVPDELFEEEDLVIGQPDAGDWGGFYFEIRLDGETHFWLIDKMRDNLPDYLKDFADSLDEAIELVGE